MISGPGLKNGNVTLAILALALGGFLLSGGQVSGGQTGENPSKPAARNAGRILILEESARIDGASSWQIFRYMTFPHLRHLVASEGFLALQNMQMPLKIRASASGNLPIVR